jgi:GNAT superfamily N-acetyltransferase
LTATKADDITSLVSHNLSVAEGCLITADWRNDHRLKSPVIRLGAALNLVSSRRLEVTMSAASSQSVEDATIRRARPEDARPCGRICYEAFVKINTDHGFPPELPEAGAAVGVLSMMVSYPGFWCVVAERNGRIIGSTCLDERSRVSGAGPVTVEPSGQNSGVGRHLMEAALNRSRERQVPSVRLLRSSFHNRSLALYTRLGFDTREPMSVMQGPAVKSRYA